MTGAWDDGGVAWVSGRWSVELRGDEIADIAYDGRPVLRSIRAVVRDRDWNTATWRIGDAERGDGMLRLPLRSEGFGSDVRGEVRVATRAGADDDVLTVTFDGVSQQPFDTNRTGLVVLHPPQLAGAALRVTHPRAGVTESAFPEAISPHQPVVDIAGLAWEHAGLHVAVAFAGDVFEMEDQRNWTDASYKTYSRPLSLPFPYRLAAGERVQQRIEVRVRPTVGSPASAAGGSPLGPTAAEEPVVIGLRPAGAFPRIGVAASTAPDPAPPLPAPPGGELLVELDLRSPNWRAALARAVGRGVPLDVRVVLAEPDGVLLGDVAASLRGLPLTRVAVFHPEFHVSEASFVAALRGALATAGIEVPVAGGSRSHFTELNRERHRLPDDLDASVVTLTPLFHSLSTAQLVESVAMQRLVATQTVSYAEGRPVHVGPIALRARFNDVATAAQPGPSRDDLSEGYGAEFTGAVDPRQDSPELAAWTVASIAALAVPGVASVSYFEEWGPRGVRAADGTPHPVAAAIDAASALGEGELLAGDSPDGLVWAVGARRPDGRTVVLTANLDTCERGFEVAVPTEDAAERRIPSSLPPRAWAELPAPGP